MLQDQKKQMLQMQLKVNCSKNSLQHIPGKKNKNIANLSPRQKKETLTHNRAENFQPKVCMEKNYHPVFV